MVTAAVEHWNMPILDGSYGTPQHALAATAGVAVRMEEANQHSSAHELCTHFRGFHEETEASDGAQKVHADDEEGEEEQWKGPAWNEGPHV